MTDHLRAGLEADAAAYEIPPGDLDAVKGRARRRTRRRHQVTASVAALALVAGTATALRLADGDDGASVRATELAAAQLGDAGITWERVADPQSSIGGMGQWQWRGAEVGGKVYALSTAPGQRQGPPRRLVWETADGIEWTMGTTPTDFFLTDLTGAGDRLYAVGTGPATARTTNGSDVAEALVGWSTPGGQWSKQRLPIDVEGIAAVSRHMSVVTQDVAAGANGVVAVVSVWSDVDVPGLLPDGVTTPNGWWYDADGVDVLDDGPDCPEGTTTDDPTASGERARKFAETTEPERTSDRAWTSVCFAPDGTSREVDPPEARGVAAHYGWDELGVTGDALRAVRGEPFAFHADDVAGSFEPVDMGLAGLAPGTGVLQADDDGFVLVTSFQRGSDLVVLRSADGRTWQRDGDALAGVYGPVAIGEVDGRLALVGNADASGPVYAELHPDGWRRTDLGTLAGLAGGGKQTAWATTAAIGPLGVVLGIGQSDDTGVDHRLLASRDGVTWSQESVADLVGEPTRGPSQIVIQGDRVTVAVSVRSGGAEDDPSKQVALVGTPR